MTDDVDVDVLFWRRAGTAGKGKLTSGLYYGTRLVINYEVRLLYAALPGEREPCGALCPSGQRPFGRPSFA
jgi:hypothetical protein